MDDGEHPDEEDIDFDELLARSSLGTPEALRIRAMTPRHVVEEILRKLYYPDGGE